MFNPYNLTTYKQAKELTSIIYKLLKNFPKDERYCIVSQLKRAVLSIGANIAEGCGRNSKAETLHFFNIALGSLFEVKYFLETSRNLNYLTEEDFSTVFPLATSLSKQLTTLIKSLRP